MHIAAHVSLGFSVGAIVLAHARKRGTESLFTIPSLVGIGAALPDLDGISVFFNHKVFYGILWYSHRGALHSPAGATFLSIVCAAALLTFFSPFSQHDRSRAFCYSLALLFLGGLTHLAGDLPCPPAPWPGLMMLWPFSTHRFGGWSHIGWLNEFLMMVTLGGATVSLVILMSMSKRPSLHPRLLTGGMVAASAAAIAVVVIFVLVSRYQNPEQWETYQRTLMGDTLYSMTASLNRLVEFIWARELL